MGLWSSASEKKDSKLLLSVHLDALTLEEFIHQNVK